MKFDAARAEQLARVLRDHEREGINRLRNIASEAGAQLDAAREEIGIWERRANAALEALSVAQKLDEVTSLRIAARDNEIAKRDAALEACQRRIAELMEANRG